MNQKKLREAKFFFFKLSGQAKALDLESEELEFYLSAFFSAGRSVTNFFDKKKKNPHRNWFRQWKKALNAGDLKLLHDMTKQRDAEVHEGGANVHAEIESVPVDRVKLAHKILPAHYDPSWGDAGVPPPEIGMKVLYLKLGRETVPVVATCKRYLELLEKLLRDFAGGADIVV